MTVPGQSSPNNGPRLLIGLLAERRWALLGFALCIVVSESLSQATPFLIDWALDSALPAYWHRGDTTPLIWFVVLMGAAITGSFAMSQTVTRLGALLSQNLVASLRLRSFRVFDDIPLRERARIGHLNVASRQTADISNAAQFLEQGAETLFVAVIGVLVAAVSLFALSVPLAAVACAPVVLLGAIGLWFDRRITRAYARARDAGDLLVAAGVEAVSSRVDVRTDGVDEHLSSTYRQMNVALTARLRDASWASGVYATSVKLCVAVSLFLVYLCGQVLVLRGEVAIGTLVAAILTTRRLFDPIQSVIQFAGQYYSATSSLHRLARLLGPASSPPGPGSVATDASASAGADASGGEIDSALRFENVWFRYDAGTPWVLRDLSFSVAPGSVVGLVGRSGIGKSTVGRLLAQSRDPDRGTILMAGRRLDSLARREARASVAVLPQTPFTTNGTLYENIILLRPDADPGQVVEAVELSGLDRYVGDLPEGLETRFDPDVHARAAGVSQLISIARLFLVRPMFILLDEALTAVDERTEAAVLANLRRQEHAPGILVVSHRASTLRHVDRVVRLAEVEDD